MTNPFRAMLIMQLEIALQMLNVSKQVLEMFVAAHPQSSKVTSSMLALVPTQTEQPREAAASIARISHQP